ncbi:hypothetical protein C0389_03555 [bacterium]|nr:hypothetical protein [bacterium]
MFKNYFYLLRCINELEPVVHGRQIIDAYTQEKDKLFLHIPLPGKPNFHLIINTNLQHTYITLKDEHFKAKKNTIIFFGDHLPASIGSIQIAYGDRLIKLNLSNSSVTILFKGGKSNIFFTDTDNVLHSFKKVSAEDKKAFREDMENHNFISTPESIYSSIEEITEITKIRKLPFLGKEIFQEVELRGVDFKNDLLNVLHEIFSEKILVYFDDYLEKPVFHPASFKSRIIPEAHFEFDNYFAALNKYFTLSYSQSKTKNVRREIDKFLSKEIETFSNKINSLRGRVDTGSKEKIYHQSGELLLANIGLIRKGMKEIEIEDYKSGEMKIIKLDEKLPPNQNIERYYDRSRSEKIEFKKSKELLDFSVKEYERLVSIRDKFEHTEDQNELLNIKKELKMKPRNLPGDVQDKHSFRHFLIENKYHVFVGKDSKNNDMLTTKFAKQNDFWFHARSVSGSHVVLRVENTKEAIPKNILQKTASLAAFYSKAKTSKLVPVTYTLKKYVNKNSRHEPGQVTVMKESVLLVKPEIPKDCEMITN